MNTFDVEELLLKVREDYAIAKGLTALGYKNEYEKLVKNLIETLEEHVKTL